MSFSLGVRIWNALAIPVTLSLIASRLTSAEQGFYYSFAGIQALSVIGELGITFVISQFAAHEHAVILTTEGADPAKAQHARARLASILRLGLVWNSAAAGLCLAFLLPFGIWFFHGSQESASVAWLLPWILFALFSSLGLVMSPFYAVLEGIGHIGDTALIRCYYTIFAGIASWVTFLLGGKLFALVALPAFSLLGGFAGMFILHRRTLRKILLQGLPEIAVPYWKEIFPLQSRVSLSWLSGYVGFYMSTPIVFRILSPELAGRYGMTTNLLLSVAGIAQIWLNTKSPMLAQQAALGEISLMNRTFLSATLNSLIVLTSGYAAVLIGLQIPFAATVFPFFGRLLTGKLLFILIAAFVIQYLYGVVNVFLRAFKQDPLFWVSITVSGINILAVQWAGVHYGACGIASLFLLCNAVACAVSVVYYFNRLKTVWV